MIRVEKVKADDEKGENVDSEDTRSGKSVV